MVRVRIGWTTEMLISCRCRDSPHYQCWGTKIRHKTYACEKCEKAGRGYFSNAWRRQTHYIKNPKLMTPDQWRVWINGKGKRFLIGRNGLQKITSKVKTTFTTKDQLEYEQKKKIKLHPIEEFSVNNTKVNWYGEVITSKQIPEPDKDMTVNAGTKKKRLMINKCHIKTIFNIKKGIPREYFFKITKDKKVDPNLWNMLYKYSICYDCGKKTINSMPNQNNSMSGKERQKNVICKDCYMAIDTAIKSMRKIMHTVTK